MIAMQGDWLIGRDDCDHTTPSAARFRRMSSAILENVGSLLARGFGSFGAGASVQAVEWC